MKTGNKVSRAERSSARDTLFPENYNDIAGRRDFPEPSGRFDDAKSHVGDAGRLDHAKALQLDRLRPEAVEVAHALAQQDRDQVDADLVDQAGADGLLNDVGAVDGHHFVPRDV